MLEIRRMEIGEVEYVPSRRYHEDIPFADSV